MSSGATLLPYYYNTDYTASTEEYGKKLVETIAFIEMEFSKTLTDGKIIRAIETISLANVFGLHKETQRNYLRIVNYLCRQNVSLCSETTKVVWKTYMVEFNRSNCVETALGHVALFLSAAHKMYPVAANAWEISCTITLFAP